MLGALPEPGARSGRGRGLDLSVRIRRTSLALVVAFVAASAREPSAEAAPTSAEAKKGLALAKKGDCVKAMPLLEKAEEKRHSPATASALAGCHLALGDLIEARDLYRGLAGEKPKSDWTRDDKKSQADAAKQVEILDDRIPVVTFVIVPQVDGIEIQVGDFIVTDPKEGAPVPPDEKVKLTIRAEGYESIEDTIVLPEKAKKKYEVRLVKIGGAPKPRPKPVDEHPTTWIGGRFRGTIIPKFWMNIAADGGTTVYEPSAEITLVKRLGPVDLEPSFGFTSYRMGPTPFKPHGKPNTEYEIVESNLLGLELKLDVLYRIPLDEAETVSLRLGGGVGFGWMSFGNLVRTQAYPKGDPNDPSSYVKCKGPNNPPGSFRYCNQLDKDAQRYGGKADKAWGDGGLRPLIYPWVMLPELGLEWDPAKWVAFDFEVGVALTGFVTGAGVRFGL